MDTIRAGADKLREAGLRCRVLLCAPDVADVGAIMSIRTLTWRSHLRARGLDEQAAEFARGELGSFP